MKEKKDNFQNQNQATKTVERTLKETIIQTAWEEKAFLLILS